MLLPSVTQTSPDPSPIPHHHTKRPMQFLVPSRKSCRGVQGCGGQAVCPPRGGGFRGRGLPLPPNAVRHIFLNTPKIMRGLIGIPMT